MLDKPAGVPCRHLISGSGCGIHDSRPAQCASFQCQWTVSPNLDDRWRPDRANLFIWAQIPDQVIVEVNPDHADAWRQEPYYATLKHWSGPPVAQQVLVRIGQRMFMVFPEAEVDMGPQQPGTPMNWGYDDDDGKRIPFAYFGDPPAAS